MDSHTSSDPDDARIGDLTDDRVAPARRLGRGVSANPVGRFEPRSRVGVDDGWDSDDPLPPLRTEVRDERIGRVISRNSSPDLSFDRSINPYRGCEHGCVYCFARPTHSYLNLSPGLDFETQLVARPNAPLRLAEELAAKSYIPKVIAIGTNTDAYQPIEKTREIMREILQILSDFNHPVAITTKGSLIERDIDILAPMAARGLVRVGISITTLDPKLSRSLEPRVPGPKRRLQIIERLSAQGIPVRTMVSPVIPGLTDHELEKILEAARDAGAVAATWSMLRLPYEVSRLFRDWLADTHPNAAAKVLKRVREAHGGKDYDPRWGKRMRGEGAHAEMIHRRFKLSTKLLGLDRQVTPLRCDLFKVPPRAGDQLSLF